MSGGTSLGPAIVAAGVALVVLGLLVWSGALACFGRLPGDIRIQRGNSTFYFPIVTCIVVSIVLTLIAAFFRR